MLPQLMAVTNPNVEQPKIRFFEGPEGARTVLEEVLKSEEADLRKFDSLIDIIELVGIKFFDDFEDKRQQKGYNILSIRTREKDKYAYDLLGSKAARQTTSSKDKREIRYVSEDLAFPMTMYMFDDKVAIVSSKAENFSLIIESKEMANMQKKIFDLLWHSLEQDTIKVGILHSISGTMAISEAALTDATLMAIEEINQKGGVLGKQLEPIVIDAASDSEKFATAAKDLINKEGVKTIFGGWTSDSRKMMLPVLEQTDHLLWYPVQYEGLEQSKNVVYLGASSNQQVLPALDWACKNLGEKVYLVGSDYVFPRSVNEIIKAELKRKNANLVGESYAVLGANNFKDIVKKIKKAKPDVILNTINGDSNLAFFKDLRSAGISSKDVPTMSFSIAEEEISRMDPELLVGDYATWSYFQSLRTPENKIFVKNFRSKFGQHRVTDDPIEAAYIGVYLYAAALEKAGKEDTASIRKALKGLNFKAPQGLVKIDENQHLQRIMRIGQIQGTSQFKVLWTSGNSIKPEPYPDYKSPAAWNEFLQKLYNSWGGWAKR